MKDFYQAERGEIDPFVLVVKGSIRTSRLKTRGTGRHRAPTLRTVNRLKPPNGWDLAILVDALPNGGRAGTLYVMQPEIPKGVHQAALDAHSMNPVAVLQLVQALDGKVGRLLVVGSEPATVEANEDGKIGLGVPVEAALDEAGRIIEG